MFFDRNQQEGPAVTRTGLFTANTLEKTLLLPSLVFAVCLAGALAVVSIKINNDNLRSQMDDRGNAMVRYMAKSSIFYYHNFDLGALDGFVKEITQSPDVTFAVFYDDKKTPVTISSKAPQDASSLLVYESVIKDDTGTLLGYLALGYSKQALIKSFQKFLLIMIIGTLLAAIAVVVGVNFLVRKYIIRPLSQLVFVADRLALGDLTATLQSDRHDEIGHLQTSMGNMVAELRGVVTTAVNAGDLVTTESQHVFASSGQMAKSATEQAAVAEEVSSSIEQMSSNIRQTAGNAKETEAIALKAAGDAREGGTAVALTVSAMKEIASKISVIEESHARRTCLRSMPPSRRRGPANTARGLPWLRRRSGNWQKKAMQRLSRSARYPPPVSRWLCGPESCFPPWCRPSKKRRNWSRRSVPPATNRMPVPIRSTSPCSSSTGSSSRIRGRQSRCLRRRKNWRPRQSSCRAPLRFLTSARWTGLSAPVKVR